ncbi:hypothetical protein ACQP3F_32485, partial [Escherichia coli]
NCIISSHLASKFIQYIFYLILQVKKQVTGLAHIELERIYRASMSENSYREKRESMENINHTYL